MTLAVSAPSWVRLARARCVRRPAGLRCALRDLAPGTAVTVRVRVTPTRPRPYRVVAEASAQTVEATAPSRAPAVRPRSAARSRRSRQRLARRMTGVSWRAGCPVPLSDLRVLSVSYRGFDGRAHTGTLIVHRSVATDVVGVMRRLYARRLPDPADGARGRLRRRRLPLDRSGQHVGVQLPSGRRDVALVGARVRPGDRPRPAREPVRERRDDVASARADATSIARCGYPG